MDTAAIGIVDRAVANLDRIEAARNFDHRRWLELSPDLLAKMARKTLGIDGRRGNDDFQIWSFRQQLLEVAKQKVDIQTAFMRFIDDDGVVLAQQRIGLGLGQ